MERVIDKMKKEVAKTNITYCINNKCKNRAGCFRNFNNYLSNKEDNMNYSFSFFVCEEIEENNNSKEQRDK